MAGAEGCALIHTHTHIYTTCVKQVTAEKLLPNTGSPAGCSVMTQRGGMGRRLKRDVLVTQARYILCDPTDCQVSLHGILSKDAG